MFERSESLADCMMAFPGRAEACLTLHELAALTTDTIAHAGMNAVASGMITGPRLARGEIFHFNTWPADWLALYTARNFVDRDPIPRYAIVSGLPVRWSVILRDLPPSDPGHDIAALAASFGFAEGVVTPVRTRAGHLGLVSIGGPNPILSEPAFQFLHTISTAALHRADALDDPSAPAPIPPRLSRREHECVTLLTQGLTEREIASRLGVSEVTARFHLDNARTKTGARSRTHLAAIAAQWLTRPRDPTEPFKKI